MKDILEVNISPLGGAIYLIINWQGLDHENDSLPNSPIPSIVCPNPELLSPTPASTLTSNNWNQVSFPAVDQLPQSNDTSVSGPPNPDESDYSSSLLTPLGSENNNIMDLEIRPE